MQLVGELLFHFPQVKALTFASIKSRYRKTIAGFLWVIINPLIMFGVQSLVFRSFLRLHVEHYSLFLLSGLLPWIFITSSLEMCTTSFLASSYLLKSFQLPPLVYLFSQLLDNLINFLAAFFIILTPAVIAGPNSGLKLLLIPFAVLLLMGGVVGMTWLLATAQVFLRDTKFILSFVISVTFFVTPVFYPESFVPDQYRWLVQINPLYQLIRPFHCIIYESTQPQMLDAFIRSFCVATLALALAALVWRKMKNEIFFNL